MGVSKTNGKRRRCVRKPPDLARRVGEGEHINASTFHAPQISRRAHVSTSSLGSAWRQQRLAWISPAAVESKRWSPSGSRLRWFSFFSRPSISSLSVHVTSIAIGAS
eukprot:scaffold289595_cov35-Tisochrysis_lutea.AAC.1